MTAIVHPGPVERLTVPAGEVLIRLRGEDTGGELSVVEFQLGAGMIGATPHVHQGHAEEFIITAGEVTFDLVTDGVHDVEVAGAGGTVSVPIGVGHGFRNASDAPATIIGLFRPAGYERYFREVHELIAAGHVPTPDELHTLRAKYRTVPA
ncbi:MAG: cupin domain-containing protein [Micromonosporaceae bacterium]